MSTARLDSLIAEAAAISQPVRMADGHTLSLSIEAGAKVATVYLWPGLDAPDTEAWENEDNVEVWLTTGSFGEGRLFGEVPVQAVRDLIEQHGGEAVAADDDNVVAAPLAQLSRAGILCLPWRDPAGGYVRVPFADGEEITFTGITAPDEDGRIDDVSTGHMVRDHGGWLANLEDGEIVYYSGGKGLPYEEDTAALVAAIIERAPRHGGSAPEEGPGDTAEQLAVKALAEWGVTAHLDDESLIGGGRNSWLVIGRDQTTDGMPGEDAPYIVLSLSNDEDDEWPTAQRPPARPADEWQVLLEDSNGNEWAVMKRPAGSADGLADCVEAIVTWVTDPHRTAGAVLLAALAEQGVTVQSDDIGLSYAIPLDPNTPAPEVFSRPHLSVADRDPSIDHDPISHTGWTVFEHDANGEPVGDPLYITGNGQPVDCAVDSTAAAEFIADWLTKPRD